MDLILIVIFSILVAILLYLIIDATTEEEEILQERLDRINKMKEDNEERIIKKKTNFIEYFITAYIEPYVKSKHKAPTDEDRDPKQDELRLLLMQSGKPFSDDDIIKFKAKQYFVALVFTVIGLIAGIIVTIQNFNPQMVFITAACSGFFGFIFPKLQLRMTIKNRYAEIAYNLPDSLDLLVVCVEAGLGLDAALTRVANEQMRTAPILAREFGRVSKEILSGIPRQEAFRNLAARNNLPDLKSFVALLIQTDKLGTSIAQSLRVYADTVRTKRRQKAEKLAAEASVKMVIPLVLFILPSMLNLIQQFTGG